MNEVIVWSPGISLDQIEKQVILKAFRFYRGNKTITAQALGIAIRTLDNKLEKYQTEEKAQERANEHQREEREKFINRQKGNIQRNAETGADVLGTPTGVCLEPVEKISSEQGMPMPKRTQVQTVLSGPVAKSHTGKPR